MSRKYNRKDRISSVVHKLLVAAVWFMPMACLAAQELPRSYEFNSLTPDWVIRCSEGSEAKVENGWVKIKANGKGYAHIQTPLRQDLVTLTAQMKSLAVAYIAWDADNRCGVGVTSPTPFGRFYSVVTEKGETKETDHRGCFRGAPYDFQIQIGNDCIRFYYRNGGARDWIKLRTIERPRSYWGAPALIAFGRNYGPGTQPFNDTLPKAELPAVTDTMFIRDVRIDPTPREALAMTAKEREELTAQFSDRVGAIVLARKEDPTFDVLKDFFPAMKGPREVVGIPEHPKDIGVNPRGRIDDASRNWEPIVARFEVGDPPAAFGGEESPIQRRLLEGYLPIDTLTSTQQNTRYELTVYGWSEGCRVDKDLYTYCRMRATAPDKATRTGGLFLTYGDKRSAWEMKPQDGALVACLRFKHPEPSTAEAVTPEEFEARQAEVADAWKSRLRPAEVFDVPDKRVSEAYRAWLAYSLLNSDTIEGRIEIHDGAGFYEEMFGHSVGLHSVAMDMYAMPDYVERIIDGMLHFQNDKGLYYMNCGLQDHGALLYAIARHRQMTGRSAWFKKLSPRAIKACDWLVTELAQTPKEGVTKGLIKFRPYNDAPDPAYNYIGNCQAAVGLKEIAEVFRAEGMTEAADRYAAAAANYRADILNSMEAAIFEHDGMPILPLEPDTHRIAKMSKYRGGDYYGLTVGSLLQTGFMEPFDRRTRVMTDLMEKRRGLVAGQCEFMEGIDHAYTYGYWMTQMQRDDIKKVLLGFWGMFAFGMTRDTYSPVEVSHVQTGENHTTLPHTYSLTEQLRFLRNLLLWEDGTTLRLGHALPREWLAPGKRVAVNGAPTLFGPVSYSMDAQMDGTIRVKVVPPGRVSPSAITVRLRHPQGKSIAQVSDSRGAVKVSFSGDTVKLTEPFAPTEFVVSFR